MTEWDEDNQAWVEPETPDGPPPGERSRRVAIVVIAGALLSVAAGAGIWAAVRGDGDDPPDLSHALPGVTLPGATRSGPPQTTRPASTARSTPGVLADPCEAVDSATARQWKLYSPEPDRRDQVPMRVCSWTWLGAGNSTTATLSVMYTKELPMEPKPKPTSVAGIPSAMVSGNDKGCVILWPASYGEVIVMAQRGDGELTRHVCEIAADFARAVAPSVPD
ncbi:DUF3558 domain-containing protein [Streptomyces sp. NBC_00190]|uniref:DUF3558 family protein n=1 Tax=unclassified Streptomyces TaxID=2593676 RepID=UPI002E2C449D|nr:DUF3558 family protein [Streptomyces sp. NBC_00190]WSZ43173.1 DUF3558 domain-containing protein [Streptomyces sp. NBC_00868]